jgi:hypothetical protein
MTKENLESIVIICLQKGIPVRGVTLSPNGTLAYEIGGFSKSDTAELYLENDKIICKTRYNRIDEIENFDDLVDIAYDWNEGYCNREPFGWDSDWLPVFKEAGLVKVETVTKEVVTPVRPGFNGI